MLKKNSHYLALEAKQIAITWPYRLNTITWPYRLKNHYLALQAEKQMIC